ncbi:MAG TPA: hypothetical protein VE957_19740 [Terriglobales bacterium]|nr:hypothetical protein [Terriglobales bacterium]
MKPFNYPERMRTLREGVEREIADYIFHAKSESFGQIAKLFGTNMDRIKSIAKNAGIVRGRGWRPRTWKIQ